MRPKVSPVLTVVCDCPRCGNAVCAVMWVKDGSLEPVRGAFSAGVASPGQMVGANPEKKVEKEGKVVPMRRFDGDFRSQPEA